MAWSGTDDKPLPETNLAYFTDAFLRQSCASAWASYQICRIVVAHAPGMPGTFYRHRLQKKSLVNYPGMHHGTCVTHVSWCMSWSLIRCGGKNVPAILHFLQEAYCRNPCETLQNKFQSVVFQGSFGFSLYFAWRTDQILSIWVMWAHEKSVQWY